MSVESIIFISNINSYEKNKALLLPETHPCSIISSVYVRREDFESDVLRSFSSESAIRHQASVDFPRSDVEIDGRRCMDTPPNVSIGLLSLCTQAVMGLPVMLLHDADHIVLNASTPLVVRVDSQSRSVVVRKELHIPFGEDLDSVTRVHVMIILDREDARIVFSHITQPSCLAVESHHPKVHSRE